MRTSYSQCRALEAREQTPGVGGWVLLEPLSYPLWPLTLRLGVVWLPWASPHPTSVSALPSAEGCQSSAKTRPHPMRSCLQRSPSQSVPGELRAPGALWVRRGSRARDRPEKPTGPEARLNGGLCQELGCSGRWESVSAAAWGCDSTSLDEWDHRLPPVLIPALGSYSNDSDCYCLQETVVIIIVSIRCMPARNL